MLQGESGRPIKHAGPSTPVRVSGFRELPRAGDEFLVVNTEARAREVCEYRRERHHVQASTILTMALPTLALVTVEIRAGQP